MKITILLILLIILINIPLAYFGNIEYLMYLSGIYLMLRIWRQIKDLLQ